MEGQAYYGWDDDEKKLNNTLKWLLGVLAALVVLGGAALYAWQSGMFERTVSVQDTVAIDSTPTMAAPVIELDGNGMFSIDNCPTTYEGLEIVKHQGDYYLSSIDIMRDGQLLRSFNFTEDEYVTRDDVHFLDANFDGYVDIFLGPGSDREYSAMFLWDPGQSNFVRGYEDGNPILNGDYQFHPASQKVYFTGSGSFSSNHAVRLSWQNFNLQSEETLTSEMLKSRLDDNQPAKYVVRRGGISGKVIFSTDDPDKIPSQWKKWAYVPTGELAAQYEEDDIEDEGTPDDDYDNDVEEVKSWIQGNWRYRLVTEFGPMETRLGISEDIIVEMMNGDVTYSGPYSIVGNELRYGTAKGGTTVLYLDKENHRILGSKNGDRFVRF